MDPEPLDCPVTGAQLSYCDWQNVLPQSIAIMQFLHGDTKIVSLLGTEVMDTHFLKRSVLFLLQSLISQFTTAS